MAYYQTTYGYGGGYASDLLIWLQRYGLSDAIIPFLLIFLVIFAVLQKTEILGRGKRNFNVMFSFLVSLMVVIPHVMGRYPPNADIVAIINTVVPQVSAVAIAIIFALLLIGVWGGKSPTWTGGGFSILLALVTFGAIIYFFGAASGWWSDYTTRWWSSDTTALIIVILVFAIVVWFIVKEPGESEQTGVFKGILNDLGKMFGGGGGH